MAYIGLGPRVQVAAVDASTVNAGNLTAAFMQDDISIRVPWFELYHLAIQNVPSNTIVTVYVNTWFYTIAQLDGIGDWDPSQPMLLQPGQDVYVCFNVPASTTPAPIVTAWFRYDSAFPNNP